MIRLAIPVSELTAQVELYGPAAGLVPYDVEAIQRMLNSQNGKPISRTSGPRVESVIDRTTPGA